ncbi:ATP-binding cassette domain-containing protein [Marispirochaeta sp.]|jgi:molybdate transport system ATP-binding protein|uniref:ATP-binding cassette domain-containing protein n=1 Tax=Marispirochaeta sp. TaxID=2038653 RepID=UPI0029C63254|nr:ATP-binding cassette domain-containing protein [Marispirochaeta sp.]
MLHIELEKHVSTPSGPRNLRYTAEFRTGACTAISGPSGAGKTTLLRMIAGLLAPDRGCILMNDTLWYDSATGYSRAPGSRGIGYVSQQDSLFPHMTVEQNIGYACKDPGYEQFLLHMTGLGALRKARPKQLSGGQRQRVALCRALSHRPGLLLLDEPFSALDRTARHSLQNQLEKIRDKLGLTVLLVSHDEYEMAKLADRALVLEDGECYEVPVISYLRGGPYAYTECPYQ